ncbi:MAG TPA: hypothetical protein V6D29_15220 [Leptolyngbyaceae cyanobacterium]
MLTAFVLPSLTIDTAGLAGIALWALALYLGFFPFSDRIVEQIYQWLNWMSANLGQAEGEFSQKYWESWNAFFASLLSILPFLGVGGLANYGVELSLGRSWAISLGLIACIGCGVYELGRRDGQASG